MGERADHRPGRGRRLLRRRPEETALERRHARHLLGPGVEVDHRQHGMYQRSEALAVRTGPVGRDGLDGHVGRRVERRHRGLLGRGHDAQAREARRRAHLGARRLPGVVPPDPRLGSGSALVRRQELVLREAHGLLDVEAQRRRIPPHDAVLSGLGAMQTGRHRRRGARHVGRPDQHGVGAKRGTAARRPGLWPRLGRIDDRAQPREPAVLLTVPDRGHDQEVARARRRHVEDARRLVRQRLEPVRRDVELGLPGLGELLALLRAERGRPPQARDHVVGRRLERLAPLLVRAARPVGDDLVLEALLGVLAVHGDVVGQVGIGEEGVGAGGLHLGQERDEVGAVEVELLVEHDLEGVGVVLGPLLHRGLVVLAVVGVLPGERDLERLRQLALLHPVLEELHRVVAEEVDRGRYAVLDHRDDQPIALERRAHVGEQAGREQRLDAFVDLQGIEALAGANAEVGANRIALDTPVALDHDR